MVVIAIVGLFATVHAKDAIAEQQDPARVFIHYSSKSPGGRRVAAEVALFLAARGYAIGDIREIGFHVSTARVRYFLAVDRMQAQQVGAHLDRYLARATDTWEHAAIQDYTWYRPLPEAGTIEVWIGSKTAFRTQ